MNIFVDTSFFISLLRKDDSNHARAKKALNTFRKQPVIFYTSAFVIDETATVLSMRVSKTKAIAFLHATNGDDFPIIVPIDEELRRAAYILFEHVPDKNVSMVDCYSAALMKRLSIRACCTFDKQFKKLGFTILE